MDRMGFQFEVCNQASPGYESMTAGTIPVRRWKSSIPTPPRKASNQMSFCPYRKPTPVGRENTPQVNERPSVKELGKLTPYLRKKGCPGSALSARGPQETGSSDCLPKTQVSAKAKA